MMIIRKPFIDTFDESAQWGEHDELPVLPPDVDVQVYGSRSRQAQPFYLSCEKDTVLVFMSGDAEVLLHHDDVRRFKVQVGDFVYVPARTPHRVLPLTETIQYRYKAPEAGREAATWFCEQCGTHVHSEVWDAAKANMHQAYADAVQAYNATPRTCASCGHVHGPVDLAGFRWAELAVATVTTVTGGGGHHG